MHDIQASRRLLHSLEAFAKRVLEKDPTEKFGELCTPWRWDPLPRVETSRPFFHLPLPSAQPLRLSPG